MASEIGVRVPDETLQTEAFSQIPRWAALPPRAWILGLLLIPILTFWVEYTECVVGGSDLAGMSMPMAAACGLLVLIPINLLVKRFSPRAALTQAELLLIYAMNTIAVYISGLGMVQFLNPTLIGWRYYATKENHWANSWYRFIPHWAVVNDPATIRDYYSGHSSLFTLPHLAGWAGAIGLWSAFIFVMLFCFYCISTLLRRQWMEREKLIFPIVVIPLEITQNGGSTPLWRNKLLWGGVALAGVLESLATIHYTLAPTLPYLPIKAGESKLDIDQYVTTTPWNSIGTTQIGLYPLVIGLTYFLSLDVSFSCWFFYLLTKLEAVAATAWGFRDPGAGAALARVPYTGEQGTGAFLGLALLALYFARPHLAETLRKAFRGDRTVDDTDEPLSYRTAWIGLLVSSALLVGFAVALGLSLGTALVFWTLFLLLALAMTRIRAEAGLPWGPGGAGGWTGAHSVIVGYEGTQSFSGQELTGFAFLRWMDSDMRCLPQPAEMEAMKIAASTAPRPLNPRHLTAALMAAVVVGTLAAWMSCLGLYYHYGAATAGLDAWRVAQGHYQFEELQTWLNNPRPFDPPRLGGAIVGLAVVSLLAMLRSRFVWWPLHPIGYAVGNTDAMNWIWFPTLVGWLAKRLILRYGGVQIYRAALPFFLGLVLGDYAISGLWSSTLR